MRTKNKAARSLIGNAVHSGVMLIFQRLYKGVSMFLVFYNVIVKAIEDLFVLPLGLVAGLWMVCHSGEVLNNKQGASCYEEFYGKLYTVFGEEIIGMLYGTS